MLGGVYDIWSEFSEGRAGGAETVRDIDASIDLVLFGYRPQKYLEFISRKGSYSIPLNGEERKPKFRNLMASLKLLVGRKI